MAAEAKKKKPAAKKAATTARKKPAAKKKAARPAAKTAVSAKAKSAPAKTATRKTAKATTKTAKKATPKTTAKKKTAVKAKPAAKKKAAAKAPAKKVAKKTTGTNKTASPAKKTATKTATKTKAKSAPAKKPTAKKAAPAKASPKTDEPAGKTKTAAAKPAAKKAAKKPAKLSAKAIREAEEKAKLAVARTQHVGQKPRSEHSSEIKKPTPLPTPQRPTNSVQSKNVKPTPEAKAAKQNFRVNDFVVYPAHGVGKIVGVEKQLIAGVTNELFLIVFEQEKMKLRVPTAKAQAVGMRGLSDDATVKKALETLKGRARIKRTMWSRRAQEYEAKINSGDIIQVAEVVRDLYRAADQPEQSYSERQLFEAAQDRLAREVAAVKKVDLPAALADLDAALLQKKAA